jgi:plastocyanin
MMKFRLTTVVMALTLAACSGGPEAAATESAPSASAAAPAVPSTGTIITIEMITDGVGNYFKPATIEAKRGDVLRYVLTSGVHNVNFVADSNPGAANLPPVSAMLQLPGQTVDVPVTFGPGRFFFQCDPHALLGMVGHVTVRGD